MMAWLRWLFRRGRRASIVLNMRPGDEITCMTPYRNWMVIASKMGEVYLLDPTDFSAPDPWDVNGAIHRVAP